MHTVSIQCHYLGNFGLLFETLLSWSHQNQSVPLFKNCRQSKNIPYYSTNYADYTNDYYDLTNDSSKCTDSTDHSNNFTDSTDVTTD